MGTRAMAKAPAIAANLRRRILEGGYLSGKLPGNRDLAASFGVTLVTIRKALRALSREGLIEAHPGSGTVVSGSKSPKPKRLLTVGLVVCSVFDLEHPYFRKLMQGMSESLTQEAGFHIQLIAVPETGVGRTGELSRMKEMLESDLLDGLAVSVLLTAEELAALWSTGRPLVVIGRAYKGGYPSVKHDADQASDLLLKAILCGGRRCVSVVRTRMDPYAVESGEDHFERLFAKLRDAGVESGREYTIAATGEEVSERTGYEGARQLLERHPRIDCMIANGPYLVPGARRYLAETGRFPSSDFTLIAVTDEDDLGDFPTLALPVTDIGRETGRMLAAMMGPSVCRVNRRVRLPPYWLNRPGGAPQ